MAAGFRLVVLTDFLDHAGQIALPGGASLRAPVGLRQEQHVVDDAGQPVQFLQVGPQDLAQGVLRRTGLERQFRFADQSSQRRAHFVCHVGIEAFHLDVGALKPLQHRIELAHQRADFVGLAAFVQPFADAVG
ncbi:hypothetical protein G6F63_014540 [Rhizopus arrhizus]|nr:hypothetical protein G6F63_014540 [Rhizopus arrhizus]